MNIRGAGVRYLEEVKAGTDGFRNWSPDFIRENPHTLPLLQHLVEGKLFLKRIAALHKNFVSGSSSRQWYFTILLGIGLAVISSERFQF